MLADDLLEQAHHLARREKNKPRQASLRRAVSTGYYALFHLLVAEIVGNWSGKNRSSLARGCEHRRMKEASKKANGAQFRNADKHVVAELKNVASAFIQLQEQRHLADYDYLKKWSRNEVKNLLTVAEGAFKSWKVIRREGIAEDYLIWCLVGRS
jgi:uncharacterized protein (UPF0332 family)